MHLNAAFAGIRVGALWHVMCLHLAMHVHYQDYDRATMPAHAGFPPCDAGTERIELGLRM